MTITQRLTGVPAGQWLLRLTMVAGLVGALLAAGAADHPPHVAYLGLVAAAALLAAVFPESGVATFAMVLVVGWWAIGPEAGRHELHPAVLVAAAMLLVAHVSALLCSYGPDGVPVSTVLVRRWLRRAILVLPVAPAVYAVAATTRGDAVSSEVPSDVWVVAALVAAAAAVLAAAQLRPSEPVR